MRISLTWLAFGKEDPKTEAAVSSLKQQISELRDRLRDKEEIIDLMRATRAKQKV